MNHSAAIGIHVIELLLNAVNDKKISKEMVIGICKKIENPLPNPSCIM
ncbi:MAG: hypothetical protein BAJALOKI1v1_150008 [Promethearchaeota archaeon]|nr:MAG: hypothetical protein BAJALOKI1v1_150008 [Candidatus Lokiarchaeota archaeon]